MKGLEKSAQLSRLALGNETYRTDMDLSEQSIIASSSQLCWFVFLPFLTQTEPREIPLSSSPLLRILIDAESQVDKAVHNQGNIR